MTDADVFGKLSRIFETHAYGEEEDLDDLLEDFEPQSADIDMSAIFTNKKHSSSLSPKKLNFGSPRSRSGHPTPYEVWNEQNQKKLEKTKQLKPIPKLNSEQWDRLVSKMHQSNRVKQSAMIKEQNQGLAHELGGYLFKPRINKTSLDLSSTMKSLQIRLPEMLAERQKEMEAKRKETAVSELANCTFSPQRESSAVSDQYLKRAGRKKLNPTDFFKYEEERKKRLETRKMIVNEIQSKELTFRPQLGEKSLKLQEKLTSKGTLKVDPITRTVVTSQHSLSYRPKGLEMSPETHYEHGPMLTIESEHPYRNNTSEYTTVAVPNAMQYIVSFDPETRTEPVYDYVRFYADETHTDYYGAGKYSGGSNGTPSNWPGVSSRAPLVIPHHKFVIYFKTNDSGNDWGFRMHITPVLLLNNNLNTSSVSAPFGDTSSAGNVPMISETGQRYKHSLPVHIRLHQHALSKQVEAHNTTVDLLQSRLNISLRAWELARTNAVQSAGSNVIFSSGPAHSYIEKYSKTHLPKATVSSYMEEMIVGGEELLGGRVLAKAPLVTTIDFDDSYSSFWKLLRTT